jgi:hypothetical protein
MELRSMMQGDDQRIEPTPGNNLINGNKFLARAFNGYFYSNASYDKYWASTLSLYKA